MRRFVVLILLGIILAAAWLAYAAYVPYQGFPPQGAYVDVPRGASARTIARLLAQNGVVRSRIGFEALCRWRWQRTLQAGEYFFDRPVTAFDVFQALAEGRIYVVTLVVPEGANKFDIAALVEREGLTNRLAFLEAVNDPTLIRDLAPDARSLEGFLFPATYPFPRRVAPREIVEAMTRRFREAWGSLPESSRNQSGLSVGALVTLASLIERETSVPEERRLIAAVFSNRLGLGRALQCDPTVIYALELADKYNGSLDSGDLNFHSPYNTYLHPGLPPGPIANPGESSLRAALNPAPVDYLYFVANTQGGHFFSRTLQEHNQNVARYRHLIAQNHPAQANGDKFPEPPPQKPNSKRPR
jgi:UPF0755 protein